MNRRAFGFVAEFHPRNPSEPGDVRRVAGTPRVVAAGLPVVGTDDRGRRSTLPGACAHDAFLLTAATRKARSAHNLRPAGTIDDPGPPADRRFDRLGDFRDAPVALHAFVDGRKIAVDARPPP